jgi:hypothetical protein
MAHLDAASDEPLIFLTSRYAQRVGSTVDLPSRHANRFSSAELAVLGAIRDEAYKASDNKCSLTVSELAKLVEVSSRTAARAITVGLAAGIIDRVGGHIINRHIHYKVG